MSSSAINSFSTSPHTIKAESIAATRSRAVNRQESPIGAKFPVRGALSWLELEGTLAMLCQTTDRSNPTGCDDIIGKPTILGCAERQETARPLSVPPTEPPAEPTHTCGARGYPRKGIRVPSPVPNPFAKESP